RYVQHFVKVLPDFFDDIEHFEILGIPSVRGERTAQKHENRNRGHPWPDCKHHHNTWEEEPSKNLITQILGRFWMPCVLPVCHGAARGSASFSYARTLLVTIRIESRCEDSRPNRVTPRKGSVSCTCTKNGSRNSSRLSPQV
ncbi:unnamed protein product, partial [Nesidiocoris tenuis]